MKTARTPITEGISRRALLRGSVAAITLGTLLPGLTVRPALAEEAGEAAFLKLSGFLTGKTLDPTLATRYLDVLSRQNPGFADQVAAVQAVVDAHRFADVDAFSAAPDIPEDIRASAIRIVSAWYLGVVGEPEVAELVAFSDALMYLPTRDYIPVPTYGPGPHTWGPDIIPGVTK